MTKEQFPLTREELMLALKLVQRETRKPNDNADRVTELYRLEAKVSRLLKEHYNV